MTDGAIGRTNLTFILPHALDGFLRRADGIIDRLANYLHETGRNHPQPPAAGSVRAWSMVSGNRVGGMGYSLSGRGGAGVGGRVEQAVEHGGVLGAVRH